MENTTRANMSAAVTTATDDAQTLALISYYLNGVCGLAVIVLGLLGNAISLCVLLQRAMRSTMSTFLTALAVWDSLALLGTLLLITLPTLSTTFAHHVQPFVVVYVYPLCLVAQTATIWIVVSFTVMRYIALCHQILAKSFSTISRARTTIAIITLASFLFNMFRWFEYNISTPEVNDSNVSYAVRVTLSEFGNTYFIRKIFYRYLYPLLMLLIPTVIIVTLNIRLTIHIRRSEHMRKAMTASVSKRPGNNVTRMLITVSMMFMACQIPAMVYNVAYSIGVDKHDSFGWNALSEVRNFLVTFNSAINFVIYCLVGRKFKRNLKTIMKQKERKDVDCHQRKRIISKTTSRSLSLEEADMYKLLPLPTTTNDGEQ